MMNNRDFIAKRAAAYFKPGDVVNLGIGIPSLCGSYAVSGVLFQSENGFIGIGPKADGLMVNERYANAGGVNFVPVPGSSAFDVAASFCVIRSGRLAATVLGGLQVSADGDLANWAPPMPKARPGVAQLSAGFGKHNGELTAGDKFLNGANGVLNAGLRMVGSAAAIYNLATGTVKNDVSEKAWKVEF